ncbi:MAG: hypothetical protein FWF87_08175 [Synergistaceae bacterium]|nr:hypothetical protein [Synergistaceae bacterium]
MKFVKKIVKSFLKRTSEFEFKNALFFIGIVLLIYLVTGSLLGTIHESHARSHFVVLENR